AGSGLEALGSVVIEEPARVGPRPMRSVALSAPSAEDACRAERTMAALARLRLSSKPTVQTLIRGMLVGSAASSLPALISALRRYRALLRHAADATREGRSLGRSELRRFGGGLDDQMVLWTLVAEAHSPTLSGNGLELALDDLRTLESVLPEAEQIGSRNDPKVERLRELIADHLPTIVFCTRRETVRHLRSCLAPPAVAWCTGDRAGLGPLPAPRASVLAWFRDPDNGAWKPSGVPSPTCLIVTDVAAEGLDLRRAGRIVHYDLPWTPMRLEQREGRAVRLGSARAQVEVIHFGLPGQYESALALSARLRRKERMPARVGIGPHGGRLWRWRAELADALGGDAATHGCAQVPVLTPPEASGGGGTRVLAGFEILGARSGHRQPLGSIVGWLDEQGTWCENAAIVSARLREAAASTSVTRAAPAAMRAVLERLAVPIRARLATTVARGWMAAEPVPPVRVLAQRLGELVRLAARARDATALTRLEAALAFVARGHTAGEAMLVEQLAESDERTLRDALTRVPSTPPRCDALDVRLTGLVLFGGESGS
ncbi:MAG TPA: C-terminal helicase domain-containing protein, partial [Gemmatimonadales bacterium]|nr:C-terminal helicase domain-containing protein [Gemmatimonadales bacterium]